MSDERELPVFEGHEPGVEAEGVSSSDGPASKLEPVTAAKLAKWRRASRPQIPGGSKGLVLGWCLWLLGSWAVLLPMEGAAWAVRGMIVSGLVGMMLLWPLVRLSESPAEGAVQAPRWLLVLGVLVEWLSLMAVFQAVVWPLRVTGEWGLAQTLWLDGAVASWSLMTAALLAMGVQSRRSVGRSGVMALCVLLLLAEPMWMGLAETEGWVMRVSPLATVWALTSPGRQWQSDPWVGHVIGAACAAAAMWTVVIVSLALSSRSQAPASAGA